MDELPDNGKVQIDIINPANQKAGQPHYALYNDKNKFSYLATQSGSHKICFQTTSSHWVKENKSVRFSISIQLGSDDEKVDESNQLASKGDFDQVKKESNQLLIKTNQYINIQGMNRVQEDQLFEVKFLQMEIIIIFINKQNERIDQRVINATIFQTIVILISGIFQIWSLNRFFKAKKLY